MWRKYDRGREGLEELKSRQYIDFAGSKRRVYTKDYADRLEAGLRVAIQKSALTWRNARCDHEYSPECTGCYVHEALGLMHLEITEILKSE